MNSKKRKYTKGPAWHKACSPKALAERKIRLQREVTDFKFKVGDPVLTPGDGHGVIKSQPLKGKYVVIFDGGVHEMISASKLKPDVREVTNPSTNMFKPGDKVVFLDAKDSPLKVTRVWYDRRGYWLYELDGDKRRKYREPELEFHRDLTDKLREAEKKVESMHTALLERTSLEDDMRRDRVGYNQRIESLEKALTDWNAAFPGITAKQAAMKMEQLQRDRNGMMDAANDAIPELNKLRMVNHKLLEIINLLK